MHRSRLGELTIDCRTDDLAAAASFWGQALGCEAVRINPGSPGEYYGLKTGANDVQINIQKVAHPSRVHLDIETDDVESEVQRLERLGATRVEKFPHWWVMEAPTGHRFCVSRPARSELASEGSVWD